MPELRHQKGDASETAQVEEKEVGLMALMLKKKEKGIRTVGDLRRVLADEPDWRHIGDALDDPLVLEWMEDRATGEININVE